MLHTASNINEVIDGIKKNGMKAGIAINPDTDTNALEKFIKDIDLVIVMGVFPGFSGQSFIEKTYQRCLEVKELIIKNNSSALIEIDGSVTVHNAKKLLDNGADVLVSGSHVFKANNPTKIIQKLIVS